MLVRLQTKCLFSIYKHPVHRVCISDTYAALEQTEPFDGEIIKQPTGIFYFLYECDINVGVYEASNRIAGFKK